MALIEENLWPFLGPQLKFLLNEKAEKISRRIQLHFRKMNLGKDFDLNSNSRHVSLSEV